MHKCNYFMVLKAIASTHTIINDTIHIVVMIHITGLLSMNDILFRKSYCCFEKCSRNLRAGGWVQKITTLHHNLHSYIDCEADIIYFKKTVCEAVITQYKFWLEETKFFFLDIKIAKLNQQLGYIRKLLLFI